MATSIAAVAAPEPEDEDTNTEQLVSPDCSLDRWLETARFGHDRLTKKNLLAIVAIHAAHNDTAQLAAFRKRHPKTTIVSVARTYDGDRPYELLVRGFGTTAAAPDWITDGYASGDKDRSYPVFGPLAQHICDDRTDYRKQQRWSA
jgi:hypothetical protein